MLYIVSKDMLLQQSFASEGISILAGDFRERSDKSAVAAIIQINFIIGLSENPPGADNKL
jgi:hypothetical protein